CSRKKATFQQLAEPTGRNICHRECSEEFFILSFGAKKKLKVGGKFKKSCHRLHRFSQIKFKSIILWNKKMKTSGALQRSALNSKNICTLTLSSTASCGR